jgi:hypothetical protein
MTLQMERHLMEIGVLSTTLLEDLSAVVYYSTPTPTQATKNHFNDPRDENGEVPY